MTARRPRPGVALLEEERHAALIGDAIDGLESFQTPHPHPGLEGIISTLRFVRDRLVKQAAEEARTSYRGRSEPMSRP